MLLRTVLLLFSSVSAVECYSTYFPSYTTPMVTHSEPAPILRLEATPDNPVVAGRTVTLLCRTVPAHTRFRLSWQRLEWETWREVGQGRDLTLDEPKHSGLYRCTAEDEYQSRESNIITVHVINLRPTVAEELAIVSLVFSLMALIAALTILGWLAWQRLGGALISSNAAAKGCPGPDSAPKGCFPQAEGDRDVYMNCMNTNPAYSNLDPASMTKDNVYASLS